MIPKIFCSFFVSFFFFFFFSVFVFFLFYFYDKALFLYSSRLSLLRRSKKPLLQKRPWKAHVPVRLVFERVVASSLLSLPIRNVRNTQLNKSADHDSNDIHHPTRFCLHVAPPSYSRAISFVAMLVTEWSQHREEQGSGGTAHA